MNRDLSATLLRHWLLVTLAAIPVWSHTIEEPDNEVIRKLDNIELRQYALHVVAEVVLNATAEEAGNQAFPILAGYIFGKNKGEKKFAMTAPVTQAAVPGGMQVQCVLPKGLTLVSAPEPLDARVQLRLVPASQWAAIRYSGTWSQSNYEEHLALLKAALDKAGVATQGEPVLARYNAPFTPWFLRRNEVWLALRRCRCNHGSPPCSPRNPPRRFIDLQAKGPYALWHHTHDFAPLGAGTLLRDTVRDRLPAGWLGARAGGSVVASDRERIFEYRARKIDARFGA